MNIFLTLIFAILAACVLSAPQRIIEKTTIIRGGPPPRHFHPPPPPPPRRPIFRPPVTVVKQTVIHG
ncbi:unnamed protein product [Caenorhabditis angaria]|uniref:Uncharacterized protein n=1 Tax=Caenorhabditis angaria TaxID=860376 RepID=A0A9P1N944_9PELO|nr:unnamed protein product [Caenorhabditis angaria]